MPEYVLGQLKPTYFQDYPNHLDTDTDEPWGANGVNPWPGVGVAKNPYWVTHP